LVVEVSVSDDFDTAGRGVQTIPSTTSLETLRNAIWKAWDDAEKDQRANRSVELWSIHDKKGRWIETYLKDLSEYPENTPPGDFYAQWGWQGEKRLGLRTRAGLEELIFRGKTGGKFQQYTVRCQALEKEEE
jgi:hypothetical protein